MSMSNFQQFAAAVAAIFDLSTEELEARIKALGG